MQKPTLFIGNKNYSSWSLRPWLALRWAGVAFDETLIPLQGPGYGQAKIAAVLAVSPTGKVPALTIGNTTIWDSLAICEWAAEQAPANSDGTSSLWPKDGVERAWARSTVAEMHSGFSAVRRDFSMNLRRRVTPKAVADDVSVDIGRICALFTQLRTQFGARGPWLIGERSIADAFYAPVVTRFRTYGVPLTPVLAHYSETVLTDADFKQWEDAALIEEFTMPATDSLYT